MNCKTSSQLLEQQGHQNSSIWVLPLARFVFITWSLIIPTIDYCLSLYKANWDISSTIFTLMKVACSFRSPTTFPGYISKYTGVHSDVSLCWGIRSKYIIWNSLTGAFLTYCSLYNACIMDLSLRLISFSWQYVMLIWCKTVSLCITCIFCSGLIPSLTLLFMCNG